MEIKYPRRLTEAEFYEFCAENRDLRIQQDKKCKTFAPLVPDFVIEIRSESDRPSKLKKKMTDTWLAYGVRLAWLIDPKAQKTYIYRPGRPAEELKGFERTLSGEDICPGFEPDLRKLL